MTTSWRHHAYDLLRWNTPLSPDRVPDLARALGLGLDAHGLVLDLGCGWAQLLADLVASAPRLSGLGVDLDAGLIERGQQVVWQAGLAGRIELRAADAADVTETAPVVLATGVAHVWGGTSAALGALRDRVDPGGRLLFGDGGWTAEPSPAATAVLGTDLRPLADLPEVARAAGWSVLDVQEAEQAEWDAFEDGWCAGLEAFAASTPDAGEAAAARSLAASHRSAYRDGYRGQLGFSYLVLGP